MQSELFLVDTSAWLLALRKDFVPGAKDRISHLLKEDVILTTGMIELELLSGTRTQKEFQRLKSRLDALLRIETDASLWQTASELGFTLRRKGITIPHTDILIAACARKAGAYVLHADAHFDMIAKVAKLKVESLVKMAKRHG